MASQTKITVTYDKDQTVDIQNRLQNYAFMSKTHVLELEKELNRMGSGVLNATLTTVIDDGNAVSASGTVTLGTSGSSTLVQPGDQVLVNGIIFQAVAASPTGNQFLIGANDGTAAANLSAAINASVTAGIVGLISSTVVANVVTVIATIQGLGGNDYDLECRGSGGIVAAGAGAQASGTLTAATAGVAGDTLTVNGIVFTAVASGAAGNQYNVGATPAITATNIAASINASVASGVQGYVYASAAAAVVTVRATRAGTFGNEFTLAGGQASVVASGARMTGGTDSAVVNFTGGLAPTNAKTVTYKFGL